MRDSGRLSITRTRSPSFAVVALVVRVQRRRRADDLLVHPVAAGDVDPHGDRLVGLGRDRRCPGACADGRGRAPCAGGLSRRRPSRRSAARLAFAFARRRRAGGLVAAPALLALGDVLARLSSDQAFAFSWRLSSTLDVDAALARDRQAAREVALRRVEPGGVLELSRRVLEAEVEDLLARLADELDQLVVGEIVYLVDAFISPRSPTSRPRGGRTWSSREACGRPGASPRGRAAPARRRARTSRGRA